MLGGEEVVKKVPTSETSSEVVKGSKNNVVRIWSLARVTDNLLSLLADNLDLVSPR